jgi:drug/metabolite transporter (DMT)-like permease
MIDDTLVGYLCAAGAAVCFGSFGVFVKVPAVQRAQVDPIVFQIYYSLAVFLSSWLLLIFHPFSWTWLGVAGAVLWVPSSLLSILAINLAGMAIAQGVWSGVTSNSSQITYKHTLTYLFL